MTEIQDLLTKLGVQEGAWGEAGGHEAQPLLVQRQAALLLKLRAVLESLVTQDQEALVRLKEQLSRLTHGGGS
jgi:hypothetical protein